MTLPLVGALLTAYNNLPAIPPTEPLGDLLNQLFVSSDAFKQPVRLATTGNHPLSGMGPVDGFGTNAGDRVLAHLQTNQAENGIYVVGPGMWVRASDADEDADVVACIFGFVEEGATNADKAFLLTTNNPIVLGVTALSFLLLNLSGGVQFIGAVDAAGDITTNSSNFTDVTSMSITPADAGNFLIVFLTDVMADASGQSVQIILSTGNPGTEITNSRRIFTRVADNIRVTHGTAALASGVAASTLLKARWRKQPAGGPNMVTMGNRIMFVFKVG
jgi:phage-related tail fiber protein